MAAPKPDAKYHMLEFTNISEAAAFVAALSRFLSSPSGGKYLRPLAAAEVWSHVDGEAGTIERIEIYMNGTAIEAEKDVFTRPSWVETLRGDQMPSDCVLLIGAGGGETWGMEEAQWHILSER